MFLLLYVKRQYIVRRFQEAHLLHVTLQNLHIEFTLNTDLLHMLVQVFKILNYKRCN